MITMNKKDLEILRNNVIYDSYGINTREKVYYETLDYAKELFLGE